MVLFLLGAAGLQGICLLVDLIWILVGAYKDGDGHRITKWIEPAGSIAILERPEVGPEQRCPRCHGDLYAQPEVCMHCRTELRWIGGWPHTVADAVALQQRQALAEAEARKAEIQARLAAAQEKAVIQEKLAAVLGDSPGTCLRRQWEKPPSRSFLRTVAAPFRRFDDWLCQSLGDDNRLLVSRRPDHPLRRAAAGRAGVRAGQRLVVAAADAVRSLARRRGADAACAGLAEPARPAQASLAGGSWPFCGPRLWNHGPSVIIIGGGVPTRTERRGTRSRGLAAPMTNRRVCGGQRRQSVFSNLGPELLVVCSLKGAMV